MQAAEPWGEAPTTWAPASNPNAAGVSDEMCRSASNISVASSPSKKKSKWTQEERIAYIKQLGMLMPEERMVLKFLDDAVAAAPLPAPWKMHRDSGGRAFFGNRVTGASAWTHPLETSIKELVGICRRCLALEPEPRQAFVSKFKKQWEGEARKELSSWFTVRHENGKDYYCHKESGETTWTNPAESIMPPYYIKIQAVERFVEERYVDEVLRAAEDVAYSLAATSWQGRPESEGHQHLKLEMADVMLRNQALEGELTKVKQEFEQMRRESLKPRTPEKVVDSEPIEEVRRTALEQGLAEGERARCLLEVQLAALRQDTAAKERLLVAVREDSRLDPQEVAALEVAYAEAEQEAARREQAFASRTGVASCTAPTDREAALARDVDAAHRDATAARQDADSLKEQVRDLRECLAASREVEADLRRDLAKSQEPSASSTLGREQELAQSLQEALNTQSALRDRLAKAEDIIRDSEVALQNTKEKGVSISTFESCEEQMHETFKSEAALRHRLARAENALLEAEDKLSSRSQALGDREDAMERADRAESQLEENRLKLNQVFKSLQEAERSKGILEAQLESVRRQLGEKDGQLATMPALQEAIAECVRSGASAAMATLASELQEARVIERMVREELQVVREELLTTIAGVHRGECDAAGVMSSYGAADALVLARREGNGAMDRAIKAEAALEKERKHIDRVWSCVKEAENAKVALESRLALMEKVFKDAARTQGVDEMDSPTVIQLQSELRALRELLVEKEAARLSLVC